MFEFFEKVFVPLSIIVPISIWIANRHLLSKASKVLFYYLVFAGISGIVASATSYYRINNLILLHFYTIFEFLLLSWYFALLLKSNSTVNIIKALAVVFSVLCVINFVFFQSLYQFNTYTRSLGALLIIIYSFAYFNQESKVLQTLPWQKKGTNWIVTGFFVFFAGSFFLFLFSNVLGQMFKNETLAKLWYAYGFLILLLYGLISIGLLNERRSR